MSRLAAWIPSIAMAASAVMLCSGLAIYTQEKTFQRVDSGNNPVPLNLPGGLSLPGLAIELDDGNVPKVLDAAVDTTAANDVQATQKARNRRALRLMQYWDFPFIAGYVTLFVVIARRARLLGYTPLKLIAYTAALTAIAAGCLDIVEDAAILHAVGAGSVGRFPIQVYGWWKWKMVFITMLLESSVFFAWTSLPTMGRILALLTGAGFFVVSLLGIQSTLLRCDASLELDSEWVFVVFVVLAVFTAWRLAHTFRKGEAPAPAES
jgi:hypothetical protein